LAALPFRLTSAQARVFDEIRGDLASTAPMNRLLQGDVGSGKTAVAMAAAAVTVGAGAQVAVMAPTELLAEQHLRTFTKLLGEGAGVQVAALVGGMRKRARSDALRRILAGATDVVVGTHALLQDDVAFRRLGLVVVDEQHRFGVRQRLALRQKGLLPHVLVMTATPIPRSLSLSLYGDLDVSVIDERPPGRGVVATEVVPESRRAQAYIRVREALDQGRQAYLVYPVVGESGPAPEGDEVQAASGEPPAPNAGRDDLRAATTMVDELRAGPLSGHCVGLVHGKMPPGEKERVMSDFVAGRIVALVATTVIEVGIDVPNASVMVVEHAERFGLAQLHQLRGRIGRGGDGVPALCMLIASEAPGRNAAERLQTLERTDDGFVIAEADLMQRGPGEFLGTRQSGLPRFEVADLLRDGDVLRDAREAAFELIDSDPTLQRHPRVREAVQERWSGNVELVEVG
jgi:ATP-dependent DNA helicase RecG